MCVRERGGEERRGGRGERQTDRQIAKQTDRQTDRRGRVETDREVVNNVG